MSRAFVKGGENLNAELSKLVHDEMKKVELKRELREQTAARELAVAMEILGNDKNKDLLCLIS
jgi:hypothetical protein